MNKRFTKTKKNKSTIQKKIIKPQKVKQQQQKMVQSRYSLVSENLSKIITPNEDHFKRSLWRKEEA